MNNTKILSTRVELSHILELEIKEKMYTIKI